MPTMGNGKIEDQMSGPQWQASDRCSKASWALVSGEPRPWLDVSMVKMVCAC